MLILFSSAIYVLMDDQGDFLLLLFQLSLRIKVEIFFF